jgi:hypothetical protein
MRILIHYPRPVLVIKPIALVAVTLVGAAMWYGIIWTLMAVWPGR